MKTTIDCLDSCSILLHGSPASLPADYEFNRRQLRSTLKAHEIVFKTRPARRHNKTGIVERKKDGQRYLPKTGRGNYWGNIGAYLKQSGFYKNYTPDRSSSVRFN